MGARLQYLLKEGDLSELLEGSLEPANLGRALKEVARTLVRAAFSQQL